MSGLDPARFQERRRAGWTELDALVTRARGGRVRGLRAEELERLGALYRRAAGDLALARRDFPDEPITRYLNDLVARAHPLLYRGEPLRPAAVGHYLTTGIPRAFRRASGYVLVSLVLSLVGVVAGWLAADLRPDLADSLAPHSSLFDRMARGEVPQGTDVGLSLAIGIILNNMRVALIAFAGGALLGIPTAFILVSNGWVLGTLGAVEHRDGLDTAFWAYVAPHGVIELSIIVFAGATGLMLADGVLRPGLLRRTDALAERSGPAAGLAVGVACLLVTCGLIEGLFSPTAAPEALKYLVGAAGGTALYAYLLLAGRERRRDRSPSPLAVSMATSAPAGVGGRTPG